MEIFFKVIGIAFVAVVAFNLIKSTQPQVASLLIIASSVLIILVLIDPLLSVLSFFDDITQKTGLNKEIFSLLIKIIGVGYLTEYSLSLCEDSGCASLGKKIELSGKIVILLFSFPIIKQIIGLIGDLV